MWYNKGILRDKEFTKMLKANDKVRLENEVEMKSLSQARLNGNWIVIRNYTVKFIGNEQGAREFLAKQSKKYLYNLLPSLVTVKITKEEIAEYHKIQEQLNG